MILPEDNKRNFNHKYTYHQNKYIKTPYKLKMAVVCALGNNKRRLSAGGTASPFRHPRACALGRRPSAHT